MKTPLLLKKTELTKLFKKYTLWTPNTKNTQICKTVTFNKHLDALVFIARVTVHAQVLDHHPDIEFTYKKVKVTLTSHEVKGLTKLDFDLAGRIDDLKIGG